MVILSLLVISNNKFSTVRNNGKTLASFFEESELTNLYQLSLHNDVFDIDIGSHALTITPCGLSFGSDSDDINFKDSLSSCSVNESYNRIAAVDGQGRGGVRNILNPIVNLFSKLKKRNFFNLICRDIIYLPSFIVSFCRVASFVKEKNIQKIFFVYPDFLFFQYFVIFLVKATNVKLTIYFTDDYLLDFNPTDSLIRTRDGYATLLNANIRKLFKLNPSVFVISQKMSDIYLNVFGIKSQVLINSNSLSINNAGVTGGGVVKSKKICISYFGSLHSGRNESLIKFSNLVVKYVSRTDVDVIINVYTSDKVDICSGDFPSLVHFAQPCIGESYLKKVEDSDYLLFMEGFSKEDIKSTWLSCSTKIPEYLSSKKPIIAFGPPQNGSMGLLISNELGIYLNDNDIGDHFNEELVHTITDSAFKYYIENFSKEIMMQRLSYE